MIATLLALAIHPAAMPPAQWLSPGLRRGDEVLYIASTGGVYVYRRHPALELAGFVFVQDGVNLVGPALGPNNDLYVINNGQSFGAGVVEEYHHSVRGFRLVRQFTGVGYGSSLAVGPDGNVYVAASQGDLLEYDASGGAPVRTLQPRRYGDVATGVAVDAHSDVFVSYQYQPSDDASAVRDLGSGDGSGCRRHRGTIVEFAPHSSKGRCINGTPERHAPRKPDARFGWEPVGREDDVARIRADRRTLAAGLGRRAHDSNVTCTRVARVRSSKRSLLPRRPSRRRTRLCQRRGRRVLAGRSSVGRRTRRGAFVVSVVRPHRASCSGRDPVPSRAPTAPVRVRE